MTAQWISRLNCTLLGATLLLIFAGLFFWFQRPNCMICSDSQAKEYSLPKGAFELPQEAYEQMTEPLLALQQSPPSLQLPDLRQHLVYYGKNGRPDSQSGNTFLHFSLGNNKSVVSTPPLEKLYLVYDRKGGSGRYSFSPNNEKSSLWLEAQPIDSEVQIQLTLENDKGEKIVEPEAFAQFKLSEKEFIRYAGTSWEIGSLRVDGTLLSRQRARWSGVDRFLEHHGGEEYKGINGKQRIDFGENEDLYSIFIKAGDCAIWDQNRWKVVNASEQSLGYPLLVVKKIDERLITFELWDVEGKGKVLLNLLKSTEPWTMQNTQTLQHMFKFVGSRTRSQCVFEINRERMTLRPSDWLLMTSKGWKKLATEEEIDHYVKRKLSGTLFVFEGLCRKDDRQFMKGTLYSPARNDCQTVELALQTTAVKSPGKDAKEKEIKDIKDAIEGRDIPTPVSENMSMRHPTGVIPPASK